jgi:hypothetical protein
MEPLSTCACGDVMKHPDFASDLAGFRDHLSAVCPGAWADDVGGCT